MALELGQIYVPDSASVIRDDMLTDFRLGARAENIEEPAVQPGTENYFFFSAVANAGMLQYANIATIRPGVTPLNATGQDLEDWRIALGLPVVGKSPAAGKITVEVAAGATIAVPNGLQFVLPNGLRGQAAGAQSGIVNGSDVSVVMIDGGDASNAEAGTIVRWVSPPFNMSERGRVSVYGPLSGGFDEETEPRKRERVLNRLGTSAGGGNWGQIREIAFNSLASLQDCYVYPILGGPASCKVVLIRAFDVKRNDYRRALPDAAVTLVKDAIYKQMTEGAEIVVQTVVEQPVDVALYVTIPDSSLAGGNGLGWVDQEPWPPAGSGTRVRVTTASDANSIRVDAVTAVAPIPGLHHIAWWSSGDMAFHTALITALGASQTSGAWDLVLDTPLVDADGVAVAANDYISPAAVNMSAYGATFVSLMGALGAGENAAPSPADDPRRLRHPFISDGAQIGITGKFRDSFRRAHTEIEEAEFSYLPTSTPTVPASVNTAPNVLTPRHFGVYVPP